MPDLGLAGGDDEIAHHGKLRAASEGVTMNCGDRDAVGFPDPPNEMMKLLDHAFDFSRHVIRDIHTSRKCPIAGRGENRHLGLQVLDLGPCGVQFIQHFKIDDVQRRTIQDNARDTRAGMKLNRRVAHGRLAGAGWPGTAGGFPKPNGC